tara:strand:+ start:181 stop:378 length:198 start_codon:yes stop_codon:yes gene_type:complete
MINYVEIELPPIFVRNTAKSAGKTVIGDLGIWKAESQTLPTALQKTGLLFEYHGGKHSHQVCKRV